MKEIDLLIINPRIMWFSSKSLIANGPLTLASYLSSRGHTVRVLDNNSVYKKYSDRDISDYIKEINPKIIGISVSTFNAYNSYRLVRYLNLIFPGIVIIGGGLHSYDMALEMIQNGFDTVVSGEGEIVMDKILSAHREGMKIKKGLIRGVPVENLDDIPTLDYSLVNLNDYIRTRFDHHAVTNQILFQRGCPFRCTFCHSSCTSGKIRNNSPEYMINAIRERYDKFGLSNFFITDSNFTLDHNRWQTFCNMMIVTGLSQKIQLMVQSSISLKLLDSDIDLLKKAGVTMYLIGVERFDQIARYRVNKAGTGDVAVDLIKRLHAHKLKSIVNVLINFGWESPYTLVHEEKIISEVLPYCGFLYINYLSPIPGTTEHGKLKSGMAWYLRRDVAEYEPTYYDLAYLIEGPLALSLNLWNLPPKTIRAMRSFKERLQLKGSLLVASNLFVKFIVIIDAILGQISKRIPYRVERLLFRPAKRFRIMAYKAIFNMFVAKIKVEGK